MMSPITKIPIHTPSLDEVANVLREGLKKNFHFVDVTVVDCPDLTQKPFYLSARGICGKPCLADVGGPPYLLPLPQKDKLYNVGEIAKLVEIPGAFVVGAGAGPYSFVGVNSELICNIQFAEGNVIPVCNNTHIAKVDPKEGCCVLEPLSDTQDFNLMGNFLCCEGKSGKVLEIRASSRTGEDNFMSATRIALKSYFKTNPVALGGVFLIEKGKAKLHVMPDFSCSPLNSDEDVDNWLKFYEMDAPLICLGELVSHDPGGHYHYDTTPDEVSYHAYFNVADCIYRIDQPKTSQKTGH